MLKNQMSKNKELFSWYSYDFGNTILEVTISLFLAQWLIVNNKMPDIWYGVAFAISIVFIVFTSPLWGAYSDYLGKRRLFLVIFSLLAALFFALIGLVGIMVGDVFLKVILSLIFFVLTNYFFHNAMVFYNAKLFEIAPGRLGQVSGYGSAFSYLGAIFGLIIVSQFALGRILPIQASRAQVFIPAAVLFTLFSLPAFFFLKDKISGVKRLGFRFKKTFTDVIYDLKNKESYPGLFRYLISYYFFTDAIVTLSLFGPVFLDKVLGLSDAQKVNIVIIGLSFTILGAALSGRISQHVNPKKNLFYALIIWSFFIVLASVFLTNYFQIFTVFIPLGFCTGVIMASSRHIFIVLTKGEKQGQFFALYSIFQKISSIFGPLLWGLMIIIFKPFGLLSYRIALLSLVLIAAIGIIILHGVEYERKE
jgi:UMF1 family MFS transporter